MAVDLSDPARLTWTRILELALHNPTAHAAVTMVTSGALTREQALVWLACLLGEQVATLEQARLEDLRTWPNLRRG